MKRTKMINKRAVSPLIATVLLIAFAVALGAIVMNWGRGYVEDTQDFARESSEGQLTCSSDVQMDFTILDVNVTDDDELTVTVRSDGGTDIYDLALQVFTDTNKGAGVLIDDAFMDLLFDEEEGNPFEEAAEDENINIAVLPQFAFLTFNVTTDDLSNIDFVEDGDDEIISLKLIPKIRGASSEGDNIACASQSVTIKKIQDDWQFDDQG